MPVENINLILDPAYSVGQARKHFAPQLEVLREMGEFGSRLLMRAMPQTRNNVPNWIVIGTLFRQVLVTFDAVTVCLENAAVDASHVHARGLFEARLYLEWVLTKGKERWARQLYTATLRQQLSWARKLIPGTQENAGFVSAWEGTFSTPAPTRAEMATKAQASEQDLLKLLQRPDYVAISASFDKVAKKKGYDPEWYVPGPGGVGSIWAMAKALGRQADYLLYQHLSGYVHGAVATNHSKVLAGGDVTIEPIRSIEHFTAVFPYVSRWAADAFRRVIGEYRGGEVPKFREMYTKQWMPRFELPEILVKATMVGI